MRSDLLFRAAGLDQLQIDEAQADAVRERLASEAAGFFRAGGVLTLRDWSELDATSRAAFIVARERVGAPSSLERRAPEPECVLRDAVTSLAAELAN